MPYPGLLREVWKDLQGKEVKALTGYPYYPNDPSSIEIIENFDSPFNLLTNYGSRVKGYFIPPETGNFTFYLSAGKAAELWIALNDEDEKNLTKIVGLTSSKGTAHNQWNKYVDYSPLKLFFRELK